MNREDCPICLGTKMNFDGNNMEECNTCDKEGKVDFEILEMFEQ